MDYVWSRGKWVAHDAEMGLDLVATNKLGHTVSLKCLRAKESSKMLGVWIAMDGNHIKLVQELKLAAVEWGVKVRTGNSSRKESW